jgi:hypothetical protein
VTSKSKDYHFLGFVCLVGEGSQGNLSHFKIIDNAKAVVYSELMLPDIKKYKATIIKMT